MIQTLKNQFALITFSLALFLSAALMFTVQPMTGKMLLPLVGGTPAGWIVTIAFFQMALLAGYYAAHVLARLSPRRHALFYLIGLVIGLFFLPINIGGGLHAGIPLQADIIMMLAVAVGVPFVALSATSSTLQRLFTETGHPSAHDPYFLYAASNLGSLAGLFAYPLVAEPFAGLTLQAVAWQGGFALLALFSLACLLMTGRTSTAASKPETDNRPADTPIKIRLEWIALAFVPSCMLSALTTHLSTDIFSTPMIWVLPLGVYLLSFVFAFRQKETVSDELLARMHPAMVAIAIGLLITQNMVFKVSWTAVSFHLFAFGWIALFCHRTLAAKRPADSRGRLTDFYLMIALGGALGGALNAFVFPHVFDRLIEYPAILLVSLLLNPGFFRKYATSRDQFCFALAAGLVAAYYHFKAEYAPQVYAVPVGTITPAIVAADLALGIMLVVVALHARTTFICCIALLMIAETMTPKNMLMTTRNFFGVVKVFEDTMRIDGRDYRARHMHHGTTIHGMQIMEPPYEKTTTTYFSELGPLGGIFNLYNPKKVAVVGLGVGTVNCYSTPETEMTFIEIDDSVTKAAQEYFTFLSTCTGKRPPRIITGDGRIELNKLDEKFDLIVMDAFSSDTIPLHLITTEALLSYKEKLNENGIIVTNISNRYFNLAPILTVNADKTNMASLARLHFAKGEIRENILQSRYPYVASSFWVAMAIRPEVLSPLREMSWVELEPDSNLRPWTDDYTNPMRMLIGMHGTDMKPALAPKVRAAIEALQ